VDEMNFSYGVIAAVGVLVAISLGLIAAAPDDIIEPRIVSVEEKPTICTMQWDPMCGIDGKTYGNLCMLDGADVKLDYEGECVVPEPEPVVKTPEPEPVVKTPEPEPVVKTPEPTSMTLTVSIPKGVGVPGCETTQECYSPYEITVATGTTVTWINDDTTVHTVTSGKITEGTTGLFDSSIFTSGKFFEFTFNDAGTYDYFCNVHPWMAGIVNVS